MPQPLSRQGTIEEILKKLVAEGPFNSAVVAAKEGLPIAMSGEADTEMIAAVAAVMKDMAERAHQALVQITTQDTSGRKVVCRYFKVNGDLLILAVNVPPRRTYRRLTNKAIRQIKAVWHN